MINTVNPNFKYRQENITLMILVVIKLQVNKTQLKILSLRNTKIKNKQSFRKLGASVCSFKEDFILCSVFL